FVLILILLAWTLALPGATEQGILRYLRPDFARLREAKVWIDAYSQIFFTLSLGFGIMIAYASYLPGESDINLNAWITSIADTIISFVAGLAIFGALGYMAAQTSKPFDQVVTHGIGLAFVAYPQVISLLPNWSNIFGLLFFLTLTVAGIASSVSIVEAFNAAVLDKFNLHRKPVVTGLSIGGFLAGIIFTTGGGLAWLDIVDHFLSHYGLFLACILQCYVVGWIYGASQLREHVNRVSAVRVGRLFDMAIRYLIPIALGVLLASDLAVDVTTPYGRYSWLMVLLIGPGSLALTFLLAIFMARRGLWKKND
ncbi:MAG TPA: sodium-dependent transporter, partial [Candidatus Binatia bacterium]|nr:sodium-dependent transporter [Candidatus Binatia bacterium]